MSEGGIRYLFLDIDGVLNSSKYWYSSGKDLPIGQAGAIDPLAVELLNEITKDRSVKVVLSSSWRHQGMSVVRSYLLSRGFRGDIVGVTPTIFNVPRWKEVAAWLDQAWMLMAANGYNGEHWHRFAVLDDIFDAGCHGETGVVPSYFADNGGRFFQTNFVDGLTGEIVEQVKEWFSL